MAENGNQHEIPENERVQEKVDLSAEFAELGKKFAEAMKTAWNSEERHNIQRELADGLQKLSEEVNKASKNLRDSDVGQKVESGVKQAKEDVKSGKVADDVRKGLVSALHSLGEAIDKMTESFTPAEEEPKE